GAGRRRRAPAPPGRSPPPAEGGGGGRGAGPGAGWGVEDSNFKGCPPPLTERFAPRERHARFTSPRRGEVGSRSEPGEGVTILPPNNYRIPLTPTLSPTTGRGGPCGTPLPIRHRPRKSWIHEQARRHRYPGFQADRGAGESRARAARRGDRRA